jgi:hypothetical protein
MRNTEHGKGRRAPVTLAASLTPFAARLQSARNLAALRRQSQYRAPRFSLAENFCLWEESIFAETR